MRVEMAAPAPLAVPALHASHSGCWLRNDAGATRVVGTFVDAATTRVVGKGEAIMAASDAPLLMLNAPLVAARLGYPDLSGLDLLELYAFVHPAKFVVPTPKGLAHALGLDEPADDAGVPALLQAAAGVLLAQCEAADWAEREGAWTGLQSLVRQRWPWAPLLSQRIDRPARAERWLFTRLPEWEEAPERPQPAQLTLDPGAVAERLADLTGAGAEARPGQEGYAAQAARREHARACAAG